MLAEEWTPEKQIGAFGVVWACVLITYFIWRLSSIIWVKRISRVSNG
jgi:hypothetical protein